MVSVRVIRITAVHALASIVELDHGRRGRLSAILVIVVPFNVYHRNAHYM